MSEEDVVSKAIISAKEWTSAQEKKPLAPKRSLLLPRSITNCPVLNTDAAWRAADLMAGLGWTLRIEEGTIEGAKMMQCVGSALAAEGLALRETLMKCRDMGIKKVQCESDSDQLVKAAKSGVFQPELYGILSDVFNLCLYFEEISFS